MSIEVTISLAQLVAIVAAASTLIHHVNDLREKVSRLLEAVSQHAIEIAVLKVKVGVEEE
jgi:ABC-type transporter Mla subunit MlaD